MKKNKKRFFTWIKDPLRVVLLVIFIGGVFFRFANTPDKFGFDKDPTRDALIAIHISDNFAFPLVGPHSGIGSFSFGPWYYYDLGLFRILTAKLVPPFYFIPLYSIFFILGMYFLGKELKDEKLGVILAGLAAFTPAQTGPITGLSNPNLIPVHAVLSVLYFVFLLKNKLTAKKSLLWGLVMGVGINHHYQMLPLMILPLIGFFVKREKKVIFLFFLTFFISFIPFIIFNILTNWSSFFGLIKYLGEGGVYIPNSWVIYLRDFWPLYLENVVGLNSKISLLLYLIVILFHFVLLIKKRLSREYLLLLLVGFILFVHLRYFKGTREYYYMFYFLPFILLYLGMFLRSLLDFKKGFSVFIFICVILFANSIPVNISKLSSRIDQKESYENAKLLSNYSFGKKISLYSCKEHSINIAEGTVYFLYTMKKLGDQTRVIYTGKMNECQIPKKSKSVTENFYDVSSFNDREIKELGWRSISPEAIYHETTEWWKY
ncbi:MAG: glycosyltransferase family 39 protein [Candidatus Levybacteria bacterium]|nr:glycosyltransferase family 39 protein [Candidatus Levybacteria bacterium]